VEFKQGEVLGIIGPNGAGKSTILKLLSRILEPNKGVIHIRGRLSALIEITAGFHPEFTGRENIYFNGAILGMSKKEIDSKFDDIVDFSGVGEFIDTPVKRYSSGMYARLGFAVAAHVDPDILLVDEVLSVGDMAFRAKCTQKMRELFNSNVTIVLVSHNLSLIQSLCKRVILINNGKAVKEGAPEEVIPYYQDIVYTKRETELKKHTSSGYKIKMKQDELIKILDVALYNGGSGRKERFDVGEPISIKVDYAAEKKIDNPVFSIEIVRADGVLCCSSNTKDEGVITGNLQGKGSVTIDLGRLNLAQGIYIVKVGIWDKDMLTPYVVNRKDIIRISAKGLNKNTPAVFLPQVKWDIGREQSV